MKRIFIGHRGVGKSSLLQRHESYFPEVATFDLDQMIAQKENQPVSQIFSLRGEAIFRELEKKYFQDLVSKPSYVIAVGAGFNTQLIPTDAEVIYVSRRTDSDGRIFLNRPRLNPEVSSLQEYLQRHDEREPLFRKAASWVYHLPEGLNDADKVEEKIFRKDFEVENAYLTLAFENEMKTWPNLNKFELRTDIFSVSDIKRIVKQYNDKRFIVSVRSHVEVKQLTDLKVDWALELGPVPENLNAQIISLHDGEFIEGLKRLYEQPNDRHLKFCPVVKTFHELLLGLRWQQEDLKNRSFLPRTESGQKSLWRWYRNLIWSRQKINFVQGLKDFDDQPSLYEYLLMQNKYKQFGAVLGNPIHHSRTPMTQGLRMQNHGVILAIPLSEGHFEEGISLLQEIGLKFAAVTSPLKLKAAKLVGTDCTNEGINSLIYHGNQWFGTSTDADGFRALIEESKIENLKNLKTAIWGGGGVISALRNILPDAVEYSARTGKSRDEQAGQLFFPDVVIWAAPRIDEIQMPSSEWNPKYILDLNYVENSMGLEYAQAHPTAIYISGLEMFYAQAREQIKFWVKHLTAQEQT